MANLASTTVNGQLVYYEQPYAWRWLDAYGPDVVKFIEEGVATPYAASNSLGHMTTTLVNASTIANVAGATGGALLITTAGAEHDGVNIQAVGEAFYLASAWPCYFGVKLQMSNATETVLYAGLGTIDSNWDTGEPDDYIAFYKADGGITCDFVVRQSGASTTTAAVHSFVAATDVILEWYYDGTNVYAYVNGTLAATIAASNANFPNDEYLTPTIDFTTGSGDARTCQIDWLRAIQVQTT